MAVVNNNQLLPGDPNLVDHIVGELKSQGIFDQFRKECIADVDTKPAYQNLRQRVEGNVSNFLSMQKWKPDMNKNQLRESLRKNIQESGFLETGVERIVDQVVNPKINTTFFPQVEDVVYNFLGMQKPEKSTCYDKTSNGILSINTDLLPTDLDPISPASDKTHNRSVPKLEEPNDNEKMEDSFKIDDEESPPFEPIENTSFTIQDDDSMDSHLSGISGLTSHSSNSQDKFEMPEITNTDSQLSKISSTSRLSIVLNEEKEQSCTNKEVPTSPKNMSEVETTTATVSSSTNEKGCEVDVIQDIKMEIDDPDDEISPSFEQIEPEDYIKAENMNNYTEMETKDDCTALEKIKIETGCTEINKSAESPVEDLNDGLSTIGAIKKELNDEKTVIPMKDEANNKIKIEKDEITKDTEKIYLKPETNGDSKKSERERKESESKSRSSSKHSQSKDDNRKRERLSSSSSTSKSRDKDRSKEHRSKDRSSKYDKSKSSKDSRKDTRSEHDDKRKDSKSREKDDKHKDKDDKHKDNKERDDKHKDREEKYKEKDDKNKEKDDKHKEKDEKSKDPEEKSKDRSDKTHNKNKDDKNKIRDDKHKEDKNKDEKHKSKDSKSKESSSSSKCKEYADDKNKSRSSSSSTKHDSKRTNSEDSNKNHKPSTDTKSKTSSDRKSKDSREKSDSRDNKSKHSDKEKEKSKSEKSLSLHRSSSSHDRKKDSKKEKKLSKDEHCSSKDKTSDSRRSADRDSNDGTSGNSSQASSSRSSSQSMNQKTNSSEDNSNGSQSGDSRGPTDVSADKCDDRVSDTAVITAKSPVKLEISANEVLIVPNVNGLANPKKRSHPEESLDMHQGQFSTQILNGQIHVKLKKPKFASNIKEARCLMRIRKRLEKLERKRQKQLNRTIESEGFSPGEDSIDSLHNGIIFSGDDNQETEVSDNSNNSPAAKSAPQTAKSSEMPTSPTPTPQEAVSDNNKTLTIPTTNQQTGEEAKIVYSDEDEDCLYFTPKNSPTAERFLKQVATLQKRGPQITGTISDDTMSDISESSKTTTRRSRKPNMKYCSDDFTSDTSFAEQQPDEPAEPAAAAAIPTTSTPAIEKRSKPVRKTRRSAALELLDTPDSTDNNNLKTTTNIKSSEANTYSSVDHDEASPTASSTSLTDVEIRPVKQTKGRKSKKRINAVTDTFVLPPSPESDVSASSGEQKLAKVLKDSENTPAKIPKTDVKSATKAKTATQRYSSDDLYKPRPVIGTTRRSRAAQGNTNARF